METVCIKLDKKVLKNLDSTLKQNGYSTRTDFIREAIRSKIQEKEDRFLKMLKKYHGAAKTSVSDERLEEIREEVFREHVKKHEIKLD